MIGREPFFIVAAVALLALAGPFLPRALAWGELACAAAALLLAQGLLRDLAKLRAARQGGGACAVDFAAGASPAGGVAAPRQCMCMESSVGALGLGAGCLALALGAGGTAQAAWWWWPAGGAAVLATGYLIKDVVIDWRRMRLVIVRDHSAVKW